MGLTMKAKKEVSKEYARRYKKVRKRSKTEVLDEFVELTGYNRCYASYILRNWGRKIFLRGKNGERFVIIGEFVKRKRYRKRPRRI